MHELLTLAILGLSVCLIGFIFGFNPLISDYRFIHSPKNGQASDGQLLEDSRYNSLQTLASDRVFGNFYKERLIKQMVKRKNWVSVIEESSIALDSIVNRRSYKIWYYKAVAECAQFKFQSCQISLYQAEILAPESFLPKLHKLKSIFNYKHKSSLKTRRQKLCQL